MLAAQIASAASAAAGQRRFLLALVRLVVGHARPSTYDVCRLQGRPGLHETVIA